MAYTFKLIGDKVVPCEDLQEWADWYFDAKDSLIIERDEVRNEWGSLCEIVETAFIGQSDMVMPPLVWQVRTGDGRELGRMATRSEALKYHGRMLVMFRNMHRKQS